jgi:hypothetical protein
VNRATALRRSLTPASGGPSCARTREVQTEIQIIVTVELQLDESGKLRVLIVVATANS